MSIISQILLVFFFLVLLGFCRCRCCCCCFIFVGGGGGRRRPPCSLAMLVRQEAVQLTEDFCGIPRPYRTLWKFELTSKAKGVDSETESA